MLLINGDVAPRRFFGRAKDFGLQYVRGISEGNGDPPGSDMWITYSSNKEDIWVSRIPVPIHQKVEGPVSDSFDRIEAGGIITDWNIHQPRWAPATVAAFPTSANKSLRLEDRDPCDYAKAVRVFPEATSVRVSFRVYAKQSDTGRLEIEVLDHAGHRPVRVVFGGDGRVLAADGSGSARQPHRSGPRQSCPSWLPPAGCALTSPRRILASVGGSPSPVGNNEGRNFDRFFLLLLSRSWVEWKETLLIVKPEAVLCWH